MVTLHSFNNQRARANPDDPALVAFCLGCREVVETTRATFHDVMRIYLRSMGKRVRVEGRSEKARLRNLEERYGVQLLEAM